MYRRVVTSKREEDAMKKILIANLLGSNAMKMRNEMTCGACGANLKPVQADLPFRREDDSIVIVRGLPVMRCPKCATYFLEDQVITKIHQLLALIRNGAQLEVIPYAA
jgi:YgiT-type zinc finger domain-containing protein